MLSGNFLLALAAELSSGNFFPMAGQGFHQFIQSFTDTFLNCPETDNLAAIILNDQIHSFLPVSQSVIKFRLL